MKHGRDFTRELGLAFQVAEYAIKNKDKLSTKYVAHLGLKSVIANQILRKYGRNKKIKVISHIKLAIPSQGIKYNSGIVNIPSLKLSISFCKSFQKINQIEIDDEYAYVSATVEEKPQYTPQKSIGVDLNTTGHCAVVAVKETGKIFKLGKKAEHIHKKYKNMRKSLQKRGLYKVVKKIKNREQRIVKDLNHKVSRSIVNLAVKEKGGLKLEKLRDIRKTKSRKSFKYALNSWSFYQLAKFIEYKALLAGVPITYVEPAYTSKCCSKCGQIGKRNDKHFKCSCGHVEHADVNAAFNIALISPRIVQLQEEKGFLQAESDTRQKATQRSYATLEPRVFRHGSMSEDLKSKIKRFMQTG
ncbi:transposase [Candidatus Oleimmundimicrobium sp.]|uniref:RNA-guided endonuclease InsQ/TnpB family protein n=1 Tax=Candidatus Oleimmundimicrobium sp. TaxID=3060597 RepID=UPI002716C298|nr:transposase [Candidatus Oleimmundimicrobium sp.]MDO8886409.1 transposase [Candidatus Oleimmundimicrobium sp.]